MWGKVKNIIKLESDACYISLFQCLHYLRISHKSIENKILNHLKCNSYVARMPIYVQ